VNLALPASDGVDDALLIPNFTGSAPDIGAHEGGDAPMQFSITAVGTARGDYNANGVVDSADYVIWRKTLGLTLTLPHYLENDRAFFNRVTAANQIVQKRLWFR